MVRLYVGGLPADASVQDMLGRFSAFGKVQSGELAVPKAAAGEAIAAARGFGYVELDPIDDAALRRCISVVSAIYRLYLVESLPASFTYLPVFDCTCTMLTDL